MKNSILILLAILSFNLSTIASNTILRPINTINNNNPIHNAFADEQATFTAGEQNLKAWVQQRIDYPEVAREYAIEGRVVVEFVIDKNGKAEQFKILKGIGAGWDEAAIEALKKMPTWKAAKKSGKNIPVKLAVGIDFFLI